MRRGCAKSGLDSLAYPGRACVGVACESCFAGNVLTKVFTGEKSVKKPFLFLAFQKDKDFIKPSD